MVIQELKPSQRVQGRWLAMLEDGSILRVGQQEIADFLHMQRSVYRRYELGEREIPVWALIRLAEYYGVSTDYLLGLKEQA